MLENVCNKIFVYSWKQLNKFLSLKDCWVAILLHTKCLSFSIDHGYCSITDISTLPVAHITKGLYPAYFHRLLDLKGCPRHASSFWLMQQVSFLHATQAKCKFHDRKVHWHLPQNSSLWAVNGKAASWSACCERLRNCAGVPCPKPHHFLTVSRLLYEGQSVSFLAFPLLLNASFEDITSPCSHLPITEIAAMELSSLQ